MASQQIQNTPSEEQLNLPEPDPDNIAVDKTPSEKRLNLPEPEQKQTEQPSLEQLDLPEPDLDNITVLTSNLPNKPILPWHHYDSPWSEKQAQQLKESEIAQKHQELSEEQEAAESLETSAEATQEEELSCQGLIPTVGQEAVESLETSSEATADDQGVQNQSIATAEQSLETEDEELRQLG